MLVNSSLDWLEKRLDSGSYFRRALLIAVVVLTFKLTEWGTHFAEVGLATKADLLGIAAVLAAVAGIPVAILSMVFNKYVETRVKETTDDPPKLG